MRVKDDRATANQNNEDAYRSRAAFYGLYLHTVAGLGADEAARRVVERYPRVRPFVERLTRPRVMDPLEGYTIPDVLRNGES